MANPEEFRGTVPPNSVEAEVSVLGAMLQDSAAVLRATEHLRPEDFYQPEHKEIFSVMMDLYLQRRPIDLVTLHTELARRGSLEGVGGNAYLMKILNSVPTSANVKAYIDIVQEKSTMRKLIQACQKISGECFTQQTPLENILSSAEKAIFDIVMNQTDGETLVPLREVLVKTYDQIDELSRLHGAIGGVPTGFIDLDNLLTGLHPGELIVVGARPSMGKTSFAMNIASHASLKRGKSVAVFTLEMPREQIAMRMLCSDAQVDMQRVRKGTLTDKDWSSLANSVQSMADAPMYIDDTASMTVQQMKAKLRRTKNLGLVIIDYLQLMESTSHSENRVTVISEITRQLKVMAKELNVPVILLSQLSRAVESRTDKRPMLSDLRESGSIEQDADIVLFLYREAYYNKESQRQNISECIVAKNRHGETGTVELIWDGQYTRFSNPDYETPPENV